MKILHIYNDYFPPIEGGIEKHIATVCEGLKDKYQMQVLVSSRCKKLVKDNVNGIDIIKLPELFRLQSAPACPTMPLWMRKLNADILHFHLPCPTAVISYLVSKPKGKVVVSYHSDIVRQKWAMGFYGPILNDFLHRADRIIAASPQYRDSSPFLNKLKDKCSVIPYGIDPYKTNGNPGAINQEGSPLLLFVGKLRYYKGLEYLVKAMKDIDAKLIIIGTGNEGQMLKDLTNKMNLQDKIIFKGFVSENELASYYNACSIFILPSILRSEAFGIVQLEAMSSGKPIVSTNLNTGVTYVNQNNITGFTVPPKDSNALSQAINKLLSDKNLRETMGRNAKLRTEKEFSKELMLDRISNIYDNL